MRVVILLMFFFQTVRSIGQSNVEIEQGFLVCFNNRVAFFKGKGNSIEDLIVVTSKGVELSPTAKINTILSFSKTIKVTVAEYENNNIVFKEENLSYVPVKIRYRSIKTNYPIDSCEMAFVYKKTKNLALRFVCNNTGYSIESVERRK